MNSLRQCFVGARNLLGVALDGIVGDDLKRLICEKLDRLVVSQHSSSNLRSLGVQHDRDLLVRSLLQGLPEVVNTLTMCFVVSV